MSARILIVDDVPANARLLGARLDAAYYQVDTAIDGASALEAARAGAYDLILLDVLMPGLDGFETCRRLKAGPQTRDIPVVMVTALDQAEQRVQGLEAGADDFLTTPVSFDTLLARVRGLVRLKRTLDESRLQALTVANLGLSAVALVEPTMQNRHALVIDDRESWSRATRDALELDGFATDCAANQAEALALVDGCRTDLVVLSLSLTAEDPLRLASRLRLHPCMADVPMLLVAEHHGCDRLLAGLDMGADDWLLRPLDGAELRARARNQIRRKRCHEHLRAELSQALQLAVLDPMTGLHNRRYLMQHLQNLLQSSPGQDLSVLMVDVDHFKAVNDRWGHRAGDHVLGHVARVLQANLRPSDTLARYGGEEFVMVMPGARLNEAMDAAERLRCAVNAHRFTPEGGTAALLTISVGVAATGSRRATAEQLLHAADQALYAAKQAGRNRSVLAAEAA